MPVSPIHTVLSNYGGLVVDPRVTEISVSGYSVTCRSVVRGRSRSVDRVRELISVLTTNTTTMRGPLLSRAGSERGEATLILIG